MKLQPAVLVSALGAIVLLSGCAHTLGGAQQDVSNDTQAVGTAAHNAGADVHQAAVNARTDAALAARNAKAESVLRPAIKLAIIRDPILNDSRNHIDVQANAATVHLTGHVVSADMVVRAQQDAQKALDDHHARQSITNDLAAGS